MGVEGIGASVVRKEDRRFTTGKGRYVDDIKLTGMTHAHFIRSPHAHAKIKSIDTSAAMKVPGVVSVLTGQQIVDDKVGNLICGWAITSKDGTGMKMGAWPAMAPETVRFVGQAVAVVIAETKNQARDAAEAVVVNYEELPVAADIRAAIKPGAPQLHPMQAAFRDNHGLQCGYCTPGMIMSAIDIVHRHSGQLDEETVRAELEGNICRCTGYHNIVKSVLDAAGRMKVSQAAE